MPLSSPAGSVNPFPPPTLRSQRAQARPSARLRTLGVLPPGGARGGGRAGLGAPRTGRGAPAGPPRRTRAAAGTQGHPVDAGEQRRKPALKPAGTHRKAGDPPRTSEPGGRAGRLRRELTFARTEAFGAGAPARLPGSGWKEDGDALPAQPARRREPCVPAAPGRGPGSPRSLEAKSRAVPGLFSAHTRPRFPARPGPPPPHSVTASVPRPLLVTPVLQTVDFLSKAQSQVGGEAPVCGLWP